MIADISLWETIGAGILGGIIGGVPIAIAGYFFMRWYLRRQARRSS